MKVSFYVTVWAGPRTVTEVRANATAKKEKIITLPNGVETSTRNIEEWIEEQLRDALVRLGGQKEIIK